MKKIVFITADTPDYYEPIERLINGEGYSVRIDETNSGIYSIRPWAYRMPGLLPIYGPLYIAFGSDWGKVVVVFLQLIFECVSLVLLSKIAESLFSSKKVGLVSLVLYGINMYVSVYTIYAVAEAFCIEFLIFAIYFLICRPLKNLKKNLFFAGLFLTWSIFFRPAVIIMTPIMIIIVLIQNVDNRLTFLHKTINVLTFLLVFFIADAAWIFRNWKSMKTFVPLYGNFSSIATKHELALYDLIIAWGGDIQNWNPGEGRWFIRPSDSKTRVYDPEFQKSNPFPSYIFTPDYNLDSLVNLRKLYWKSFCCTTGADSAVYYSDKFVKKAENFKSSFISYHPLQYYVSGKIRHAATFVLIRRPYALPFISQGLICKLIRGATVVFYYTILLLAFVGIIKGVKVSSNVKLIFFSILLYLSVHIFLGYTEFRYLLPTYPFLTIFAANGCVEICNRFSHKKINQSL